MSLMNHQAVKGVVWSAMERFSVQGIQFILAIIIARLVSPSEYGLIAMLAIFLAIAQSFVDSGFSNALIQKKGRTEVDYSTVFYFNLGVSIVIYLLLFVGAPYIAAFYKEPVLSSITRWVGLNIILSGLSIVQRAQLTIRVDFKTQAKASLIAVILSGAVAVYLAYAEYGVWALVTQSLLNTLLNTLFLWIFSHWFPSLVFSWSSFRTLFSFGFKLLLSGLLHTIYINLYSLVIGRWYSSANVGYYNRAYQFASFPSINIVSIITRAIYPVQCAMQDDDERLNATFMQYLRLSCLIIFLPMVTLAVLAKPLILILLTEKWIPAAELLSILCLAYMWYPIMVINNNILNVKGRSDYFLKAEILKKIVAIAILFVTLPYGVKILCWGVVLYNFFDMGIIIFYSRKVIRTGYREQIYNILPIFLLAMIMGGFVWITSVIFRENPIMQLSMGCIVAVLSYIVLGYLFQFKEFKWYYSRMKNLKKK